ncbi:MAG: nitroreductase family protein [Clostridia bacterium]
MSAYAATWPLNDFYSPEKSTSLFEAIPRRQSCRCFLSAPSTEQWNALGSAAKAYALPDVRIALGLCDTALFQPFMGLFMKFENVQRYAAIITRSTSPQSIVDAGVSGEMLMLHAVSIGLAGVWVAGTYKKSALSLALEAGEQLVALIALGVPAQAPDAPVLRKRKPLSKLLENDFSAAPIALREAAKAVLSAPSALNRQPWRMRYEPQGLLYLRTPSASLDLGIATAHVLLALGKTPALFTLSGDGATVCVAIKA